MIFELGKSMVFMYIYIYISKNDGFKRRTFIILIKISKSFLQNIYYIHILSAV